MKHTWYHGTMAPEQILTQGFASPEQIGIWGKGVYLTNSLVDASKYGAFIVEVDWDDQNTLSFDYEEDIPRYFPYLSYEEEEGAPEIQELALLKAKEAVSIRYSDGSVHLIVYKPEMIQKIRFHEVD